MTIKELKESPIFTLCLLLSILPFSVSIIGLVVSWIEHEDIINTVLVISTPLGVGIVILIIGYKYR